VIVRMLRYGVALVWLAFGIGAKVLNLVPRHRAIVARVLGEGLAGPLIIAIGLAEALLGLWMASGFQTLACVALQTAAIVIMNTLEIWRARDLLLFPWKMVALNVCLLCAAWYVALRG
jgi:hypothetical protein